MFKGVLEITSDPNYVATKYGYTVLVLGEYEDLNNIMIEKMEATILLPPYAETMLQLDGNINEFAPRYINYLNSPDVRRYLAMIFLGMVKGMNFIMYIGRDEVQLPFYYVLLDHFLSFYGIAVGEINKQFVHDINNPNVDILLYEQNVISPNAFLTFYPLNMQIPIPMAIKLAQEYKVYNPNVDPMYYVNQYTSMRNMVNQGQVVKPVTPMQIIPNNEVI